MSNDYEYIISLLALMIGITMIFTIVGIPEIMAVTIWGIIPLVCLAFVGWKESK